MADSKDFDREALERRVLVVEQRCAAVERRRDSLEAVVAELERRVTRHHWRDLPGAPRAYRSGGRLRVARHLGLRGLGRRSSLRSTGGRLRRRDDEER
jgi:hypothetical protein